MKIKFSSLRTAASRVVACALLFTSFVASSEGNRFPISGTFHSGEQYSGWYTVSDEADDDGYQYSIVEFDLRLENTCVAATTRSFSLEVDRFPRVTAGRLGLIVVANKVGGMQGHTYLNYIGFDEHRSSLANFGRVHIEYDRSVPARAHSERTPLAEDMAGKEAGFLIDHLENALMQELSVWELAYIFMAKVGSQACDERTVSLVRTVSNRLKKMGEGEVASLVSSQICSLPTEH